MAAANGHLKVVEELIKKNANINAKNDTKSTPLRICNIDWACLNNHYLVVKYLIENKADPTILNEFGKSPIDDAKTNDAYEVLVHNKSGVFRDYWTNSYK